MRTDLASLFQEVNPAMSESLFDPAEFEQSRPPAAEAVGKPRLRIPQRNQVEMRWASLDELLPADHPARIVWAAVCGLDLSRWLKTIKAVEGGVGRDATDPRVLVALWVYATLEGEGSARKLADWCTKHLAFQWLCGGVTVNHHLLSDFRSQNGEAWKDLMTQIVASLMAEDLVTMQRVAQDGMRVRAHAGKASFRRRKTLEAWLEEARRQVETLEQLAEEAPDELTQRQREARQRAVQERQQRLEEALRQCHQVQAQREANEGRSGRKVKEARASSTDPEARIMQFSDGGFRPGYNVQFSTDTATGVIVGVDVTNVGNDSEQLPPMLDQLEDQYQKTPDEALVDGGFASKDAIEQAQQRGCTVYAPLKDEAKQKEAGRDPYAPKKGDTPAIAAWRQRMGQAVAQQIYRLRCQTAEWVNAQCRNRGFWQMPVRGLAKCRTVALLYAITHNVLLAPKLRAAARPSVG
jgi:transposase